MPFEYTPPKYAQVIAEIQRRIESGEYPPGSLLPSEHQLSAEFGMARPTVVRALRVLRQEGWIDTQQGKGSFVRGRPALAGVSSAAARDRRSWTGTSPASPASWSRPGRPRPRRGSRRCSAVERHGSWHAAGGWSARTASRRDRDLVAPARTWPSGRAWADAEPAARRRPLPPGPVARACASITWSSRSPPAAPPRMRRSCSASPGRPRCWRCT